MEAIESFQNATPNKSTWPTSEEIVSSPHWLISTAVSLMVILANTWIATSFIHYVISTKVFQKRECKNDVNTKWVMGLALLAIIMPFFRYIGTVFLLFVSLYPDFQNGCEIANDICLVGFALAILPTYGYLWVRQHAFYGHPSLGHMFGTCVSVFSNISLILIMISAFISMGLGVYPTEYEPGPGGCFLIGSEEQNDYRTYIYAAVMIISQLILLGLFLHPLRIHAKRQMNLEGSVSDKTDELSTAEPMSSSGDVRESNGDEEDEKGNRSLNVPVQSKHIRSELETSDNRGRSGISQGKTGVKKAVEKIKQDDYRVKAGKVACKLKSTSRGRNKKLIRLIKRVLYLALVSISSDLTVMMINAFAIPDDIPQTYSFVMYDVNMLINVITVILSFESWQEVMFYKNIKSK